MESPVSSTVSGAASRAASGGTSGGSGGAGGSEPRYAPILPIFLIVLVDVFGMTLVLPLLAIYAEHFNATPLQATLLVSVYAACQLLSGPLIGKASDHTGRKPMLLMSQVGTFIGFIVMARATSLWMLYLARGDRRLDGREHFVGARAYISDNTDPKNRAKSFALIGIAFGVGFFLGPTLAGLLSASYGLTAPIYAAAAMSATSIICTATFLGGGQPPQLAGAAQLNPGPGGRKLTILNWKTYAQYFRRPGLRARLLQFFCSMISFSLFMSGFALFAERRFLWAGHPFGVREVGYFFGYLGFMGIILQGGLMGRLVEKFGETGLVTAGFLSLAVSYVLLAYTHTVGLLLVVGLISTFGNGVLRPTLTSLITQDAGRHEQGVVLGLMQSLNSMASIFSPMMAGILIGHHEAMSNVTPDKWLKLWAFGGAAAAAAGCAIAAGRSPELAAKAEG